jgi:hypothetical protein
MPSFPLSVGLTGDTISSIKSRRDCTLESKAEDRFYEPVDISLLPVTRVDAANLIRASQQLEVIAKRQAPRIAFKARVESYSWIWLRSWQCKPKVITFRCDTGPIPICCASLSRLRRRSSNPTVLFASTARSSLILRPWRRSNLCRQESTGCV